MPAQQTDQHLLAEARRILKRAHTERGKNDELLLHAAQLFYRAGALDKTETTLAEIDSNELNDSQFVDYQMVSMVTAAAGKHWNTVKALLDSERFALQRITLAGPNLVSLTDVEAQLAEVLDDPQTSIRLLIELGGLLEDRTEIQAVHDRIWRNLFKISYERLQNAEAARNDRVLLGWYQLAGLIREAPADPQQQIRMYRDWQQFWSDHPAAKIPPSLFDGSIALAPPPSRIALMLSMQGEYEVPGTTLLDGFMFGYFQAAARGTPVPEVRILDTSNINIADAYSDALTGGAEMLIGPMRKSEVEGLLAYPQLAVPVVTLNRIDRPLQNHPQNFYQFGLSPLDEIDQIVERAWRQNFRRVVLISQQGGWSERAGQYFSERWKQAGGDVIEIVSYNNTDNDFTPLLKPALNVDSSEQRSLQLERLLGRNLEFTPRRRQDLDFVVLLAYPDKARQIKPALDFLYAGDVPVYATSYVFSGSDEADTNRDLSGIEFTAMPWTVSGNMAKPLQPPENLHIAYRQLYALGYDAYLLHTGMQIMTAATPLPVFGATGILQLENGIVKRRERWARFDAGKVVEVQP